MEEDRPTMPVSDDALEVLVDSSAFDVHEPTTSPATFDVDAFARRSQCEETGRLSRFSIANLAPEDVHVSVPLDAVPALAIARGDLVWVELPPGAAQLIMRIDGVATLMHIVGACNLTASDAARVMARLVRLGIVRIGGE